jgi:hypothetical protein
MGGRRLWRFVGGGLLLALVLALAAGGLASSAPDGLEKVAEETGFLETAREHLFADGPLADYTVKGVAGRLGAGLAGLLGVLLTFALGLGLFALVRRRGRRPGGDEPTRAP